MLRMNKGFTLVESLISLMVVSIILIVFLIQPVRQFQAPLETKLFFDQLASEIKFTQQLAVLQGHSTLIYFDSTNNQILFRNSASSKGNKNIYLPEHLKLQTTYVIRYLSSGRIGQFRTIFFYNLSNHERIRLVFQLGNGQFEIQ